MAESGIPVFPKSDISASNLSVQWSKWINRLDNLFVAMNINDANRKKAMMLNLADEEMIDLYETFTIDEPNAEIAGETVYSKAKEALQESL